MTLDLRELSADEYATKVLPLTYEIWGYGRTFDAYVERTRRLTSTAFAKRSYSTLALTDGRRSTLATLKRYERAARLDSTALRAVGIGAVYTAPEDRGRGYASAMIGLAMDRERQAGADLAFLFSDIHPQFYRDLGFVELPSRTISFRADSLPWQRLRVESIEPRSWSAIRACFNATAASRTWTLERPALFWSWIRMLLSGETAKAQRVDLVVRRSRGIVAYVLGRREPRADAYVVDEFGFIDEAAKAIVPALLRYAAGDLRRIAGWLPPAPARTGIPRGSVRRRRDAICMAAPLSRAGHALVERAKSGGSGDPLWSTDHI